jgi:hypothetical protein
LLIRHATDMCHIPTLFMASLAPSGFSTLSHKRHDFRRGGGGKLLKIKCVVWCSLQLLSKTFLILRRV